MDETKIQPKEIDDVTIVFGPSVISELLPDYKSIPEIYCNPNSRNKWVMLISKWFFRGLPEGTQFIAKEGIDSKKALRHVMACLRSWEPPHEHKEAGCAYLMSLWFDDVILPNEK